MSRLLERLRHHVTGSVERGEAVAIEAVDSQTTSICWIQEGARFEAREGEHWIPMRTGDRGLTVHIMNRTYCGCMVGWRGDTGQQVRVAASDTFDVVRVGAR